MTRTKMNSYARILGLLAALALRGAWTLSPAVAAAQEAAPLQRIADGTVVNKSGAPIAGAVVYLKDSKGLTVRTYLADNQGRFHFGQLAQNSDYEIWADSHGTRSKSKNISSFDSKNDYSFTLKIDSK